MKQTNPSQLDIDFSPNRGVPPVDLNSKYWGQQNQEGR